VLYTPHEYQKKGIKFGLGQAAAGFFLDPGLGKTSIMYAIFKVLKVQGMVNRMLVVAPLRPALSVWPGEQEKWDDFQGLVVKVLHRVGKAHLLDPLADVHVINPEGLPWLLATLKKTKIFPWEMLVVDESTRFKHTNTQRFKNLKEILPKFQRRYILTGSPAPNGLLDLFGQIYILDGGAALGRVITHYRMNYFDNPDKLGWQWVPRKGAPEVIYEKLRPLVLRMEAKDYLELPELINNTVEVTLPARAKKVYDQMESTLLAAVDDNLVVAANAAAATSKCRQIANGGIYHGDGKEWTDIHDQKIGTVAEIVEELQGKPCLVAYEFDHDLARLRTVFPEAPHIGGGVSANRFREIERSWNAGEIPVLLAQPQSVAHGLNLQGTGATIIWHSLTWNLEDYDQFIRRVWRQGQKERVVVHHIVAKDTVDEAIMKLLLKKDKTQRALLDALKEYVAKERS